MAIAGLAFAGCASTQADVAWDPAEQPIGEVLGHEPQPPETAPLPTPPEDDIGIFCLPGERVVEVFSRNETEPSEIAQLHVDATDSLTAFRLQAGSDVRPAVDRLLWAVSESGEIFAFIDFDEDRLGDLDPAQRTRFEAAFDIRTMTALDQIARSVQDCPGVIESGGVDDLLLDRFEQDSNAPEAPRHPDEFGDHGENEAPTTVPPTTMPHEGNDNGYEPIVDPAYCLAGTESVGPALDTLSGLPTDPDTTAAAFGLAWEGYTTMEILAPLDAEADVLWLWTGLTNAVDILGIQYDYDIGALVAGGDTVQIEAYQADLSTAKLALASAMSIC